MVTIMQVVQVLEHGWANYFADFERLSPEVQESFLSETGFDTFHDLLAHIIGWWEEGLYVITGILDDPGFTWKERETDSFNDELVEKYKGWSEEDLRLHFENIRQAMVGLMIELPDNALDNKDIRDWLEADVIEHLEEHRIPAS